MVTASRFTDLRLIEACGMEGANLPDGLLSQFTVAASQGDAFRVQESFDSFVADAILSAKLVGRQSITVALDDGLGASVNDMARAQAFAMNCNLLFGHCGKPPVRR